MLILGVTDIASGPMYMRVYEGREGRRYSFNLPYVARDRS